MWHAAVAFRCSGMRKFYVVGRCAPAGPVQGSEPGLTILLRLPENLIRFDRGGAGKIAQANATRICVAFRQVTRHSRTDAWSSTRSNVSGTPMELSTLRQAPRSDRLRTVQSIVTPWPLKAMCAPLRTRWRAAFRRSCGGFSIVRFSAADIADSFPCFKILCQKAVTFWYLGTRDFYLVGRVSRRLARSPSVSRFACKCTKVLSRAISKPAFRLPAIMLQPSMLLDFRHQRRHVRSSALLWMLTFWPRDEPSRVSFLACNLISFDCPGHVGRRLKIPLPPRRISRLAPRLKERPTID